MVEAVRRRKLGEAAAAEVEAEVGREVVGRKWREVGWWG